MKWNEFLDKLAKAREQKKDKKINVVVLANLIFSGAFDAMIEGKPSLSVYRQMFEDVKAVKESVAKLPSKKKGEFIGLDEVDSEIKLGFWRSQRCPIVKKVSIENELRNVFADRGFEVYQRPDSIFTFKRGESKDGKRPTCLATPQWSALFKKPGMEDFLKGKHILVYGMVHSVELKTSKAGSERLIVRLFTGQEVTDELIIWPKYGETKISERYKAQIKLGELYGLIVKIGKYNGKATATILSDIHLTP